MSYFLLFLDLLYFTRRCSDRFKVLWRI